jgi:transposase
MPQMLLPIFPGEATSINPFVGFSLKEGMVYYFNGMMPIFCHAVSNHNAFRLITSQMIDNGVATQKDIVKAFGVSPISVKRNLKIYRKEGLGGFFKLRKGRGSTVLIPEVLARIQGYLDECRSVSSICAEMSLKADTVNKAIRDKRLHRVEDVEKKSPYRCHGGRGD